ncbi:hypothetical protein BaRGS_00021762 [Batillaria attramentaria]|uniref:Alpha-amylase n=1 Tax=Batillaria attramentaria TaxID=370345 RepID=A0ABD0KIP8_9CAEN
MLVVSCLSQYRDPHCGGRQVIVELFQWTWDDVAAECETFLGPKQFCGVQVSPPSEHVVVTSPPGPWWEQYQPVSYRVDSRSGTEAEFRDMIRRCGSVDVRIYVDAVLNNMAEIGRYGKGIAGSSFDSDFRQFGAVPYNVSDFNDASRCPSADGFVHNFNDAEEVRNCSYMGFTYLDQSREDVQVKIASYLNHLIDLGVAGFRVDKAKFMWPQDIAAIQRRVKDLPEGGRTFFVQHVTNYGHDGVNASEYRDLGYVTEFRYATALATAFTQVKLYVDATVWFSLCHLFQELLLLMEMDQTWLRFP